MAPTISAIGPGSMCWKKMSDVSDWMATMLHSSISHCARVAPAPGEMKMMRKIVWSSRSLPEEDSNTPLSVFCLVWREADGWRLRGRGLEIRCTHEVRMD